MIDQSKNRVTFNRPNFDEPFILQTDASELATGAVLKKRMNFNEYIISVDSYKLSYKLSYKSNYRDSLFGKKFILITDSRVNYILLTAKLHQVSIEDSTISPAYRF